MVVARLLSTLGVARLRLLTIEVFLLRCSCPHWMASGFQISHEWITVRVRVALRQAVYRQSVRLGAKPLDAHDQGFFRVRVTSRLAVYRQTVRLGAKPLEAHDQSLFIRVRVRVSLRWRFTPSQFVLAPSLLRLMTRVFLSESELVYGGGLPPFSSSWRQASWGSWSESFYQSQSQS
jgi:hypothetical protein